MSRLRQAYDKSCNDYVKSLCSNYEFCFDDATWIADDIGGILEVNDFFLNMHEIIFCVDMNVIYDDFVEFYDYNLRASSLGLNAINIQSWFRNCPHLTEKQLDDLEQKQRDICELKELLQEEIDNYNGNRNYCSSSTQDF